MATLFLQFWFNEITWRMQARHIQITMLLTKKVYDRIQKHSIICFESLQTVYKKFFLMLKYKTGKTVLFEIQRRGKNV